MWSKKTFSTRCCSFGSINWFIFERSRGFRCLFQPKKAPVRPLRRISPRHLKNVASWSPTPKKCDHFWTQHLKCVIEMSSLVADQHLKCVMNIARKMKSADPGLKHRLSDQGTGRDVAHNEGLLRDLRHRFIKLSRAVGVIRFFRTLVDPFVEKANADDRIALFLYLVTELAFLTG